MKFLRAFLLGISFLFIFELIEGKSPCDQPKQSGNCMAYFERYYYNDQIQKCQKFIYGGSLAKNELIWI